MGRVLADPQTILRETMNRPPIILERIPGETDEDWLDKDIKTMDVPTIQMFVKCLENTINFYTVVLGTLKDVTPEVQAEFQAKMERCNKRIIEIKRLLPLL